MKKILIIQTAFIGDVILATGLTKKLGEKYPDAQIDFLLRKGNESLLKNNPFVNEVIVWDKKGGKYKNLYSILKQVRKQKYDHLFNLQRFGATGLLTWFSKAKEKVGFKKNPFSFSYHKKIEHSLDKGLHEVERNNLLIEHITGSSTPKPVIFPNVLDEKIVSSYKEVSYICIAPTSIWFTKQVPVEKWLELIKTLNTKVYLLGAPSDKEACNKIIEKVNNVEIENLAGELTLLQSAALMKNAQMNYVNDSAPMHLCSAVNANVTAVYCSTIPEFGFGPLSDNSKVIQIEEELSCRPCGLHGFKSCPKRHFNCAHKIKWI